MQGWLLGMVTAPRWFDAAMVSGAALFTFAMGYIAGYSTGRRDGS